MFYIYQISTNKSYKKYIGYTKCPLKRFKKHHNDLLNNRHHCLHLQRFYNNNNIDCYFLCEILFEFDKEEDARKKEEELISDLSGLFNVSKMSSGGDLTSYHPNLDSIKEKHRKNSLLRFSDKKERMKHSKPMENNPNWKGGITKKTICPICGSKKYYKSKLCKSCNEKNRKGKNNSFYGKTHSKNTVEKILKTKKERGTLGSKPKNIIRVEYNSVIYDSLTDLSKIVGCTVATVKNRATSDKFPEYKLLIQEKFND